jgi:hypothetical protein
MKPPPADSDILIECPRCGQTLTYADARGLQLYPALGSDGEPDSAAGLRAMAVVECRCGHTQVDIQQRGNITLAIPRPGKTLGGSSGVDASVIL